MNILINIYNLYLKIDRLFGIEFVLNFRFLGHIFRYITEIKSNPEPNSYPDRKTSLSINFNKLSKIPVVGKLMYS